MAVLAHQTLVGTVGRIYELRTVGKDNREVIDFSVAVTDRKRDGDDWVDGETYWMTVTAWNRLAKNIAESLRAGDRVIVDGFARLAPGALVKAAPAGQKVENSEKPSAEKK